MNDSHLTAGQVRSILIKDVFHRFIQARVEFSREIGRCALKGWPDKTSAIRVNRQVQELLYERLLRRLEFLFRDAAPDSAVWNELSTTKMVHTRVQDDWTEQEEQMLLSSDTACVHIQKAIQVLSQRNDPSALDGPFAMAKRDPELLLAWSKLNETILNLDRELLERRLG